MDFSLNEEQQIVRDTAKEFAEKTIKPRAEDIDKNHEYPTDIIKQMGEMGFMGVAVPKGRHEVAFRFRPRSFSVGLGFSIIGLIFLAASSVAMKKFGQTHQLA